MKWIALPALGLAALIAGCASSPPSKFYSLTAVAPESSGQPSPTPVLVPVQVVAVHIPPTLDRQEIVRLAPGNRLQMGGLHRWGAPLDEMIQRVLSQDLLERLPAGKVVLPSAPAPAGTDRIVLNILQFQSDVDGTVQLEGSWSLLAPGAAAPALIRNIDYHATANPSAYGDQAQVLSTLLGRLASDIAMHLPDR